MQYQLTREFYKSFARHLISSGFKSLNDFGLYSPDNPKINYIVEKEDWSVRWDGKYISTNINKNSKELIGLSTFPANIFNRIVHFGSHYMWLNWESSLNKSNKYVVTYFHGKPEDGKAARKQIEHFIDSSKSIDYVVTAATVIEKRLQDWGIPKDKIIKIPLGVDTENFSPIGNEEKTKLRKKLGIPDDCYVIGSFQKDGVGWGDGMEPKLIKGPDIFVKAMERLSKHFNIFVLLTGPARGYVKKELERLNIPYLHKYASHYPDLNKYYRVLDAYLVASREEGGPKAILESMASGVPIVSTNVGMAEDVILNRVNGYIVPVADHIKLSNILGELLASHKSRENIRTNAFGTIKKYDWNVVAEQYLDRVYKPLINNM